MRFEERYIDVFMLLNGLKIKNHYFIDQNSEKACNLCKSVVK